MRALLKKLESAFDGAVQVRNFGRSEGLLVEVESAKIVEVSAWLRMEEGFRLDFLESLTLHEAKGRFHFTFFVRSIPVGHHLAVRASIEVPEERELAEFPSIARVWPQATPFETELAPLFGIRFLGGDPVEAVQKDFGSFDGYPLRKSFTWGKELMP